MRAIDELHLEYPFLGARQLRDILALEGPHRAGRCHVGTLMAKMGILTNRATSVCRRNNLDHVLNRNSAPQLSQIRWPRA
jgi:putative transposase